MNSFGIHPFNKAQTLNKNFEGISEVENPSPAPEDNEHTTFNLDNIFIIEQDFMDQLHALTIPKTKWSR